MAVDTKLCSILSILLIVRCTYSTTTSGSSSTADLILPSASILSSHSSNPMSTPPPSSANISLLSSATTDCFCDLMVMSCDSECCCDMDCTADEIRVFSKCVDTAYDSSTSRFCINDDVIFRSSLSNTVFSGLFCVYTDNYPGRTEFSSIDTVDTLSEAEDRITEFGSTATVMPVRPSFEPFESDYYRSGDPIEIIYDSNANGYLPLPVMLNDGSCHDGNPITYLNDYTSSCLRYLSADGRECTALSGFNAEVFYQNFSVLTVPSMSSNDNTSFVPVELQSITCHDLSGQTVPCGSSVSPPVFNSSTSVCENGLLSLSYIIAHNATRGLMFVSADIVVGPISIGLTAQSFSVQFVYSEFNETENAELVRPGNPGYVQGQPLLAGVLTDNGVAVNVSSDSSEWLTIAVAGDGNGVCQGQRESVVYRDDYRASCIFKVPLDDILNGCDGLDTLSVLLGPQPRTNRIATYGNADVNELSQWIEVLGLDDDSISSQMGCSNVITGIQLILFYTYTGDISSPQGVVTGANIRYLTEDIKPQCSLSSCSSTSPEVSIVLESAVTFVPVYTPPDAVLLSTSIPLQRLPQDFLYPLFASSDAAEDKIASLCRMIVIVAVGGAIFQALLPLIVPFVLVYFLKRMRN